MAHTYQLQFLLLLYRHRDDLCSSSLSASLLISMNPGLKSSLLGYPAVLAVDSKMPQGRELELSPN
jgi:hypothetical protein